MNTTNDRDRCWITHKRRAAWNVCPLCGAPIKWVRLWNDEWSPCDDIPVLFLPDIKARTKIIRRRETVSGAIYKPRRDGTARPIPGRLPHFYSCPVLKQERRAWVMENKYCKGV